MGRFFVLLLSLLKPTPDLQSCVEYWQRELNLQDWNIVMRVVPQADLYTGELGDIEVDIHKKTATIRLMMEHESDLSGRLALADQRYTIVHEMVHLRRFADHDPEWGHEGTTNAEANKLVRQHHRWLEWLAIED